VIILICRKCHQEIPEGQPFCGQCGAKAGKVKKLRVEIIIIILVGLLILGAVSTAAVGYFNPIYRYQTMLKDDNLLKPIKFLRTV
jgi:predicted nucleic acid-binding Zn ribbon protein